MTLTVTTAAIDALRSSHYVYNPVTALYERSTLLEGQRTNICLRSEEFDNATWSKSAGVTVTANAASAPDGAATADLLASDGRTTSMTCFRNVTFTGDGEKCVSLFVKAGTAAATHVRVFDNTAGVSRRMVLLTWTAGVPAVTGADGAGTIYSVVTLSDGWYRIAFSATGVVAANSNGIFIYPASTAATAGNVYAWGAQVEDASTPSSYIPTTTATVTRSADNCSVALPSSISTPQEMTAYTKFVEMGTASTSTGRVFQIGTAADTTCLLVYSPPPSAGAYRAYHHNGAAAVTSQAAAAPAIGDLVELRVVLGSDGKITLGQSINGAAEVVAATSAANALAGAWNNTTMGINSRGTTAPGFAAFQSVKLARGTKTLAQMRAF